MDFRAIKSNGDISKAFSGGEIVWIGMDDVDILLSQAKRDYRIYIDGVPTDNDQPIKSELESYKFFSNVSIPQNLAGYDNLIFRINVNDGDSSLIGYEKYVAVIRITDPDSERSILKVYIFYTKKKPIPLTPPPRKRS